MAANYSLITAAPPGDSGRYSRDSGCAAVPQMTRYSPAGLLFNRYQPRSAWPAALRDIVVVLVERLVVAPRRGPGMCGCRGVAQIEVARAQCGGPMFVLTQSLQLSNYLLANFKGIVRGMKDGWMTNAEHLKKIAEKY